MTTNTDTQAHGGGVEAVREAHKKWWSTRGGIGMACFASSGDQERAFAKADKDFAFAVAAILAASPAAPAPAAGVDAEALLPCDVAVAPATIIRKGCKVSTLMLAIKQREGRNVGDISDAAQTALAAPDAKGER